MTSSCFILTNQTQEEQLVTATAKREPIVCAKMNAFQELALAVMIRYVNITYGE